MLKKIVLITLVMLPCMMFAQEAQKIAYANNEQVIVAMPEYKAMQDSLQKQANAFRAEVKTLSDEYAKKMSDYVAQQDSLNDAIKQRRIAELQEIQQRADNFQQYAAQQQEELQQKLGAPIQEKLQKAINDVGKENNFLYIVNVQAFFYVSPNAVDATPLIKKKLGL